MKRFLPGIALGILLLSASASADIVDQVYDPVIDFQTTISNNFDLAQAQTFTVGLTGTLRRVDVNVRRTSDTVALPLLFDVRTTTGGLPTQPDSGTNILATASISATSIPTSVGFVTVDVSAFNLFVTNGEVLAIALRTTETASAAYAWSGTRANGYLRGKHYSRFGSGNNWQVLVGAPDADMSFRTFVNPIPEPSSGATGFALMGLMARCRARRRGLRQRPES